MSSDTAANLSPEGGKPAVAEERESFGGQVLLKKYMRRLQVEIVGLCVLMAIVWGLLTLPIVFFYRPVSVCEILLARYSYWLYS